MNHICIFAGTTEGRRLAEFLGRQPVKATVCVATEYGEEMIPASGNIQVSARRLPPEEIGQLFRKEKFDLVIDATHPYAVSITESISRVCQTEQLPYVRLLRQDSEYSEDCICVPDVSAAVSYLNQTEGIILLSTGSKELQQYTAINQFEDRVYARVLPMESSLEACQKAGLKPAHIIAMQGPFSEELNTAMLKGIQASWMVTKDGGDAGGFRQKMQAVKKAGASLVVIGRPPQKEGCSYEEVIQLLCSRYGCSLIPEVSVVGIGPGSRDFMTEGAIAAIRKARCLIGARRMLESVALPGQQLYEAISPEKIRDYISAHKESEPFAVVMSGDTGFYSGTKKLLPLLSDCSVKVIPGISSLSYLCARVQVSYEDILAVSLHGRERDIAADVRNHKGVFALTGGEHGVSDLLGKLVEAGLGNVRVFVGERLSYPKERITSGTAEELQGREFDSLSAVLIENTDADESDNPRVVTHGLPDSLFERGEGSKGVIPMTKSEVRSVSLSKLQLTSKSLCWDVGAGTGSVAIEMARQADQGLVYAIEKNPEAIELLKANRQAFRAYNLTVIAGTAPKALEDLPAPTHVFIGGSSGNIKDILELAVQKNPKVRIVATAISLESLGQLTGCLASSMFTETEIVSVTVAKDRKAGHYHLMTGQNPVYICTLQAGGNR